MVVVEGTREEPTVYHCNAISEAGSPLQAALEMDDDNLAQNRIGQKVNWMSTRMSAMSTADPKALKAVNQTAAQRKGTIQTDYMLLAQGGALSSGNQREWAIIRSNIARTIGIQKQTDKRIRIQKSLGTVFGARRNGMWTFYYQKLVCYEIWKDHGIIGKKWRMDQGNLWYVAECREFWPNGGGHAV